VLTGFLFAALAPDDPWTASALVLLQCVTLISALWTSGVSRADSPLTFILLALASASAVANLIPGGRLSSAALTLFAGVLTVAVAAVLAVGVADQRAVNRQSVRAAITVYVLLGMLFAFFFSALAVIGSDPFFAQGTDGTRAERVYFSYVTLATLGYGDYTPAGTVGHTLAVVEALAGQLYLVTVVALLVARLGSGHGDSEDGDPPSVIPGG